MNRLSPADLEFARRFASGELPPREFDHRAHLRHHRIDPVKVHETLTQAWLQAVWHFMQRAGDTSGSDDLLQRSAVPAGPRAH